MIQNGSQEGAEQSVPGNHYLLVAALAGLVLAIFTLPSAFAAQPPLKVVTDNSYPPYVFPGPEGEPQGYVVDLWQLWQQKTGVEVEFTAIEWSKAQRALLVGQADVIDMIFRTPVREQLYDFSAPYATLPVGIYVDPSIDGITDVGAMQGFVVGVQKGDACADKLSDLGIDRLAPYANYEAMLQAASRGDIKMFCMDDVPAAYYLYLYQDQVRFAKAFALYEGQFHWAVSSGDTDTYSLIERGMNLITAAEREQLREKWLSQPIQFRPFLRAMLGGILFAALLLLIAMLWIGTLRRQVNARIAEIEQKNRQLEATSRNLAVEKAQLRTLIDRSPDAMALKDEQGVYIDCNEALLDLIGKPRDEIVGRTDQQLYSNENLVTLVRAHDIDALRTGETQRYDTELTNADGHLNHLEVIKVPIRAARNAPLRLLVVARDVSERWQAERERRIAAVAFESQDGMIITGPDGIIERANSAFSRITGYAANEAIGRSTKFLRSGQHEPEFYNKMWASLELKGYWTGELINRHCDGHLFTARLSVTAVRDEKGNTRHYVGNMQDISSEKQAYERVEHLTLFDQLTGLPNRLLLNDRLHHALENSSVQKNYGAMVMADLDLFQKINDALGHATGDHLLQIIMRRIQAAVCKEATLSRFSGDIFVLVLENQGRTHQDAANAVLEHAEAIRKTIAQPVEIGSHRLTCTASLGITLFHAAQVSPDQLLRHAELATYKSKALGRNRVSFYEDSMQAELEQHTWLEAELRKAISADQLVLYYQVQVNSIGEPIGAEALIRWMHPERGLIPPVTFIPLAEETGLIEPIGAWVIESACRQLACWAVQADMAHLTLAVNVSPRQFKSDTFVEDIIAAVDQNGASAEKLKIEVTESLAIDDFDASIIKLECLQACGFPISLDDFGTGNSSLNYLTKLPLTQLKIDKSFVDNLPSSHRDALVAQTIIAMGQGLELDVIAEGVETRAQQEFLTEQGCHAFQGYLFGKPLPIDQFEAAIQSLPQSGCDE